MDRNVCQTDMPLVLETEDNDDENKTALNDLNRLDVIWTKTNILHVSIISVLMLLTLLGNVIVIITIISRAELRKKRVNVFILNLAVGDLMVCFVSMPTHILLMVFGQWVLGPVTCKLSGFCYVMVIASTTFLLTAMSIDRYQVRITLTFL